MYATDPHHRDGDAAAVAVGDFYGIARRFQLVTTERGESLEYDVDEVQRG